MRVAPNTFQSVNQAIQSSEQSLQIAISQLSSGKRIAQPSDDPLAFSQDLQSIATFASVDRYSKNADAVLTQAQQADSSLSSVVTALTQALSLGTEAGDANLTSTQRAGLVQQLQGILSGVVAQANTTLNGTAIFAGTSGTLTPFIADPSSPNGYTYQGTTGTNQTTVGEDLQVTVNVPGNAIFTDPSGNVLGSLQQVINATQSGSTANLASATDALSGAIAHIGQVRATYGSTVNQLTAQNNVLSQETVSLTSQQNLLVGIDTATAATNLTQAQTTNSAVLAMAAKILPQSLLNFLH